jgi:ABC-type amino acid transport substrate-binding protein/putative hemolysin
MEHKRSSIPLIALAFLVLLAIVVGLALAACVAPAPASPTATPTATQRPTFTPQPVAPADDWTRIKEAGVLQVASALDNAPFDMYDARFKPDGFDIALITEMARRLGLQVEVSDFAFEGLLGALQLKQADAVIAAMAITKDRLEQADFTPAYYVGEDGILAAPDSPITSVTSTDDLTSRLVGVVRGTVYEAWVQKYLIQTGQMPASNLQTYSKADDAVAGLKLGRLDLVILDREVAQTYASQGQGKVVGKSNYVQNYGIAVRKGSSLLPQLDKALAELQADGTIGRLAEKYLKITPDHLLPTPTPAPQPTEAPTPAATATPAPCVNGMAYVADLNLDDHNMTAPPVMQPGQAFTKGWRIRNSGTCDWAPSFTLGYVTGNSPAASMGGQPVALGVVVPPGSTYDIYVNLVAPRAPGVYQGFWQMRDTTGVPFGQRVYVGIQVPAPPTVAPPPTQTPAPGIFFGVDRTQINAGECVVFNWNVTGVKAVYFYPDGQPYQQYGVPGQGSQQVCPQQTTTYDLRVVQNDGSVQLRQITINVIPVVNAPVITRFDSNPQGQIPAGQCLDLHWTVQGAVDRVALVRNSTPLWDYAPVSGSHHDCPPAAGTYTYEIQAWGPGGFAKRVLQITVTQQIGPQPNPASQNCVQQGGQVVMQKRGDGGEYGVCMFEDNRQCEEWAMLNGACPVGGVKVTGYTTSAATYCAITGGQYAATGKEGKKDEQGTCTFNNGVVCDVWAYYNGQCSP